MASGIICVLLDNAVIIAEVAWGITYAIIMLFTRNCLTTESLNQ